jgi:hypothetical protein
MLNVMKPSATTTAAAALLLLLVAAAGKSAESAGQCGTLPSICRHAVTNYWIDAAQRTCCDGLFNSPAECYCEVVARIRAEGLDVATVSCLGDAGCPGSSSLRGSDDSSSTA